MIFINKAGINATLLWFVCSWPLLWDRSEVTSHSRARCASYHRYTRYSNKCRKCMFFLLYSLIKPGTIPRQTSCQTSLYITNIYRYLYLLQNNLITHTTYYLLQLLFFFFLLSVYTARSIAARLLPLKVHKRHIVYLPTHTRIEQYTRTKNWK